jgi:hypothetical protein
MPESRNPFTPFRLKIAVVLAVAGAGVGGYFGSREYARRQRAALGVPETIDFNRDVRPIINTSCIKCHGGIKEAGGVSFQFPESILKVGASGKAPVSPHHPDKSKLIERITAKDPAELMPPGGPALKKREVAILKRWIEQGAPWGLHWAYKAPEPITPPEVKNAEWIRSPIDRFVLARLEKENLPPNPEADKATLLRRISFDLTGLPPSPEETDAFVADTAPDAYERAVNRLLASPHFGERWAAVWMDLARYGDSRGYEKDLNRPMWPYRDWLVGAYNADMPFDKFTAAQLAGDLFPNPTTADLTATAFNRLTLVNDEGGTDDEEYRTYAVMDRTSTTMTAWMGTTFSCVQCHGHPYDPIRHDEYYKVLAFFNNSADADRGDDAPTIKFGAAELKAMSADLGRQKDALTLPPGKTEVRLPVMRELAAKNARKTQVFIRGNWMNKGAEVKPETPALFGHLAPDAPRDRLGFARWLVTKNNPLTARVAVSRLWEQLFGLGLVPTLEDFGSLGERPEHPELLDWLALRFRDDNAWSVKKTLRDIVMSSTYRQSSVITPEKRSRDPRNLLLARYTRTRLPFEMVRDQALVVSGLFSPKLGGPSVMPAQPAGLWNTPYSGEHWTDAKGDDAHRRALYTFWKRSNPYPSFLTFDGPLRDACSARRINTNSPLQAMVTLNDPVYVECAKALAKRMKAGAPGDLDASLRLGVRLATGHPATDADTATLRKLHDDILAKYWATPADAAKLAGTPEEASLAAIASVILNMDSVLNKF